jgi:hypothetical protein
MPALRAAYAMAFLKLAVHVITLRPYGFFRDELYYIACSEHLAWGYVDQPPFCVAVLRAWRAAFGDSLASIRMLPALVGAATVLVTGFVAIELGGGALAVALAGTAVLTAGQILGTTHYYSMNVFDLLFWVLGAWLALRALRLGTTRAWIILGVMLGVGLMNKTSVLWLGAGLFVGLLATPARATLRTRGPWIACALAVAIFAPYLAWEVRHGWPTLEFMRNAMGGKYVGRSLGAFVREQIDGHNPFALPLWAGGLFALLRGRLGDRGKVLASTYVVAFVIVGSQKTAKSEYMSPAYPMLMAAGGVFWEGTLAKATRPWVRPAVASLMTLAMTAGGVIAAPFALAVLSEGSFVAYARRLGKSNEGAERREQNELGQFYADMHGWPELAAEVADVWDALAPEEKARATIWTRSGGYGPAAAIDFFGRARHLPPAICAHNNYWYCGPGSGDGSVVIVVGGKPDRLAPMFASFEQVATFECRWCRPDENHKPIYVGRRMNTTLAAIWPEERWFD